MRVQSYQQVHWLMNWGLLSRPKHALNGLWPVPALETVWKSCLESAGFLDYFNLVPENHSTPTVADVEQAHLTAAQYSCVYPYIRSLIPVKIHFNDCFFSTIQYTNAIIITMTITVYWPICTLSYIIL